MNFVLQARLLSLAVMSAGLAAGKCRAMCVARMRVENWSAGCCTEELWVYVPSRCWEASS